MENATLTSRQCCCLTVCYCSQACQAKAWPDHGSNCPASKVTFVSSALTRGVVSITCEPWQIATSKVKQLPDQGDPQKQHCAYWGSSYHGEDRREGEEVDNTRKYYGSFGLEVTSNQGRVENNAFVTTEIVYLHMYREREASSWWIARPCWWAIGGSVTKIEAPLTLVHL